MHKRFSKKPKIIQNKLFLDLKCPENTIFEPQKRAKSAIFCPKNFKNTTFLALFCQKTPCFQRLFAIGVSK
jgi:hypothetical protein